METDYATSIEPRRGQLPSNGAFRGGSSVSHSDFDQGVTPFTSYDSGSIRGMYTVRGGETLASIAANTWGDASLWYKIAEANGLNGSSALFDGQQLVMPAGVVRSTYNASTFTPYDPSAVMGDTVPTSPVQPKPFKGKCGAFGQILLAVVATAVAVVVSAGVAGMIGGQGFLGGVGALATPGATLAGIAGGSAGVASATGGFVAGAIGGAVGSATSQWVGVATGIQEKFSWNSVALAGLSGGIGGARGGGARWEVAARDAIYGNIAGQGAAMALGWQSKFDWAGLAGAGVGAVAGFHAGGAFGSVGANIAGSKIGAGTASAIANAATRSLIAGTDFGDNVMAALPDAIGSAIGGTIGHAVAISVQSRGGGVGLGLASGALALGVAASSIVSGGASSPEAMVAQARASYVITELRKKISEDPSARAEMEQLYGTMSSSDAYGTDIVGYGTLEGRTIATHPGGNTPGWVLRMVYGDGASPSSVVQTLLNNGYGSEWITNANPMQRKFLAPVLASAGGVEGSALYSSALATSMAQDFAHRDYANNSVNTSMTQFLAVSLAAASAMSGAGLLRLAGGGTIAGSAGVTSSGVAGTNVTPILLNLLKAASNLDITTSMPALPGFDLFAEPMPKGGLIHPEIDNGPITTPIPQALPPMRGFSPIDDEFAGPFIIENNTWTPENAALQGFPGIGVTANGGPTFAGTEYLYPVGAGQKNIVSIPLTGYYPDDFAAANAAGNFGAKPKGYSWHHVDDYNVSTGYATLQLVLQGAHEATNGHVGSAAQYRRATGNPNAYPNIFARKP